MQYIDEYVDDNAVCRRECECRRACVCRRIFSKKTKTTSIVCRREYAVSFLVKYFIYIQFIYSHMWVGIHAYVYIYMWVGMHVYVYICRQEYAVSFLETHTHKETQGDGAVFWRRSIYKYISAEYISICTCTIAFSTEILCHQKYCAIEILLRNNTAPTKGNNAVFRWCRIAAPAPSQLKYCDIRNTAPSKCCSTEILCLVDYFSIAFCLP